MHDEPAQLVTTRLMIVNDFDLIRVAATPLKTEPPLIINANAMLAFAISHQGFQAVSGWTGHILQHGSAIQLPQLSLRDSLNRPKPHDSLAVMKAFGVLTAETQDHTLKV